MKLYRWSDGSMSLHLGNEIFDIHKQPLAGDHNHMFIRQVIAEKRIIKLLSHILSLLNRSNNCTNYFKQGTGLQGQAIFRNKLSFRPHSTESFTHQKMTRQMADRTNRGQGIKVISQVT